LTDDSTPAGALHDDFLLGLDDDAHAGARNGARSVAFARGPRRNAFARDGDAAPAMATFLLERTESLGDDEFPATLVAVRLQLDVGLATPNVPQAAQRRIAWRLLKELMGDVQPEELQLEGLPEVAEPTIAPISVSDWSKPGELDMRIVKSAHRMVLEVAQRGASGRSVLASELVGAVGLSAPTVGRLLKDGEAANEYLRQFVQATAAGRTKALDLTPKGRLLASKIRAGTVPA
jgi:hypothetical protein